LLTFVLRIRLFFSKKYFMPPLGATKKKNHSPQQMAPKYIIYWSLLALVVWLLYPSQCYFIIIAASVCNIVLWVLLVGGVDSMREIIEAHWQPALPLSAPLSKHSVRQMLVRHHSQRSRSIISIFFQTPSRKLLSGCWCRPWSGRGLR
jgi:hypothetical protein